MKVDARDKGSTSWARKIPWEAAWQLTPVFCLDGGAWRARVHRVAKSQTWLKRLSTHAWVFERNILVSVSWCRNLTRLHTGVKFLGCWECIFLTLLNISKLHFWNGRYQPILHKHGGFLLYSFITFTTKTLQFDLLEENGIFLVLICLLDQ